MRLDHWSISTRLYFGLGVVILLTAILGGAAWLAVERMWGETQGLYEHPLMVRRAIGELKADVLAISRGMSGLCLTEDDEVRQSLRQQIAVWEANADRQLEVIRDRYLGPPSDVEDVAREMAAWSVIREESLRLLQAAQLAEAVEIIMPGRGESSRQLDQVLSHLDDISRFATTRGDAFYASAQEHRDGVKLQLGVLLGATLLVSGVAAGALVSAIRRPLKELTLAAEQFRCGKLDVRCGYESANELGLLARSFNSLAETVETELRINEQAAQLTGVMLRESDARAFARGLLAILAEHTGSQMGALYLLNEARTEFEHFESIGLTAAGRRAFSALDREGEFGLPVATGRVQRIAEIPADTPFGFATPGGDFRPREIVTLPLLDGGDAVAVLSLASVRPYDSRAIRLLETIQGLVTARLIGVLAFHKIQEFAARLEDQNRELEVQKQELSAQAEELSELNAELEMQKRQLEDASRQKSAFLSKMSHELRTPLNSVIALSGVLERRLAGKIPGEESGYLEVIGRSGRHLLSLINDILDLSRIEAGREEVNLTRFSLPLLVGEVAALLEPLAREKELALVNQVSDDLPPLVSDPDKVRHILHNLAGNAVKFTETGVVEISARRAGDEVQIAVRDTGIGIAAEQIPHIFEEFRQADDSAARKYGGTGLGLAIAQRYATMLGGDIRVHSAPGQGSTFTLRLPLTVAAPESAAAASSAPPQPAAASARDDHSILLVEDSEPAIIQLTDMLTDRGYRVRAARGGPEALAEIERALPDAVILDLMMPGMDGFAVLKAIREADHGALLPVLILTAKHVTKDDLAFLHGNHVSQLIQKGDVNREELLAAVSRLVASTPPPAPPTPRRVGATPAVRPLILVVDDNLDNIYTFRALLQDDYRLLEATNGRACVDQAQAHRPDLILMDIAMPVMNGIEALQEIRKDPLLRRIPVIAVTASAMLGDRETILSYGFDAYVSKPISDEAMFRDVIRKTLD